MRTLFLATLVAAAIAVPLTASADAGGVGLGVAAGADISKSHNIDTNAQFSWSFFVDIPLMPTFYITPQTAIYELKLGPGIDKKALTDVDLNFKFLVPLGFATLGAGLTAGLTTGLGDYLGHYGALAYFSLNLVANLDAFAMVQYKRLQYGGQNIDNIHGYLGGMWKF